MTGGASTVESQDTLLEIANVQRRKDQDRIDPPQPILLIGMRKITTTVK
jgi:hypothetical protein